MINSPQRISDPNDPRADDDKVYGLPQPRDDYEEFVILCPVCRNEQCSVHIQALHRNGTTLMCSIWSACGGAATMRIFSGLGPLTLAVFDRHRRYDHRDSIEGFVVIDPPPAWARHLRKAR